MFTCGILIRKREPKRIKTVNRSVSPIFKCMPTIWFFSAINKLTPVVIRIAMKGSDLPKEGRAVIETERDASMGVIRQNRDIPAIYRNTAGALSALPPPKVLDTIAENLGGKRTPPQSSTTLCTETARKA